MIVELAVRRLTVTQGSGFRAEDAGADQIRFIERTVTVSPQFTRPSRRAASW
jgi:hypothetical protein